MGLSISGIAVQILASVSAFRAHPGLSNASDCKVVVNHLIRKFSEPAKTVNLRSKSVASGAMDIVKDHAIPVKFLADNLLNLPDERLQINDQNRLYIEQFLDESICVVEITRSENRLLTEAKLSQKMPDGWLDEVNPKLRDRLARYRAVGIEIE